MQTRDAETVGKAGDVSRLDGPCYDNTKAQVESWRGEGPEGVAKNPEAR